MAFQLEYHVSVKRSNSASVLAFGLIAASLAFAPQSSAQINGAPSSVTSPGFGGRSVNGTASSVTSLGPRGYTSNPHVAISTSPTHSPKNRVPDQNHRRRGGYLYAYPVPYAVDGSNSYEDAPENDPNYDDPNYQGGPTIFDRRGSGEHSYIPPVKDAVGAHAAQNNFAETAGDPAAEEGSAESTTLVFKDGHMLDIGNYAIVGQTLFDMTPGHSRHIALADLNLDATRQKNDDHGVLFQLPQSQLPQSLQAN
jgi:hypothetical protein